jgi:DNA-binding response OmpR family regulator
MAKKILVVDDDEGITEVIQLVLESEGHHVITSIDGNFLALTEQQMLDLILLDVLLPGKSGQEICQRLKSDPDTAHIPVIMLSAHTDTGDLARKSGADDFLEKPFDVEHLIAMVEKHLTRTSALLKPEELQGHQL